jgi:hypothetical protein
MKSIKRSLSLSRETLRHLTSRELGAVAGGNGGDGSVYECTVGTLVSCAACTDLRCVINTSVITSCH